MNRKHKTAIAILAGVLYILAFPPFPFGFFSPISLALVFYLSITATTRKEAFLYPFLSGLVSATGLLYWIPRLMGSGLYVVLVVGMVLLLAYMALWVGLVSLATFQINKISSRAAYVLFPVVWVAQEKLRELGEISFPWITAGYSFGSYTTFLQALSLFGVYFYSLLIASTAVTIMSVVNRMRNKKSVVIQISLLCLVITILFAYGKYRIHTFDKQEPLTQRIAVIQSNIDPLIKWERRRADSIFTLHVDMTREAASFSPPPVLIIWPESALPVYFGREHKYKYMLDNFVDSIEIPLIFGTLDIDRNEEKKDGYDFYNSVFFKAAKSPFVRYDKIRLLPFAERLPFEGIFPIISRVDLGEADFTPGDTMMLFDAASSKVFAPICYEVVYQDAIRDFARRGGTLMAHVTNDGWFGRSAMPYQHLNISLFRSIESGIPLARCANTGVSATADACGRVVELTKIYEPKVMVTDLNCNSVKTFFAATGDIIGYLSLFVTLILLAGRIFVVILWKKLK